MQCSLPFGCDSNQKLYGRADYGADQGSHSRDQRISTGYKFPVPLVQLCSRGFNGFHAPSVPNKHSEYQGAVRRQGIPGIRS